jgi:hypothetical protein
LAVDLFDPVTQTMAPAGSEAYARLYHSVALLLPDATVWVAGSNPSRGSYQTHMEIYQPAYLFTTNSSGQTVLATRPSITSSPAFISYGTTFQVQTPNAANIASVALIRNGSVTHAFNMDQRMVGLSFTAGTGVLNVTAPANGNLAPPGYYMLFLVDKSGVPSVANFVQVGSATGTGSAIKFVQVNSVTPSASVSSVGVAFSGAQTAGNLNVVVVGWNDTTSSVTSVADSLGNVYTQVGATITGTGLRQAIYYAKNIAAGSNKVTVTFNQAANAVDVRILEYSGASTTSPVDVVAPGAAGSGSTATSGSATTTVANDLIFGAAMTGGAISGPGSGFTSRVITPDGDIAEDKVGTTIGSYNATAPVTPYAGLSTWVIQMVAFKPGP